MVQLGAYEFKWILASTWGFPYHFDLQLCQAFVEESELEHDQDCSQALVQVGVCEWLTHH